MRTLMICLLMMLGSNCYAGDPAAELATAKDAVENFLTNNTALLLNVTVGDQAVKKSTYSKTFMTSVSGKVIKTKCTRTTTENHTVLHVGTDVTSPYYYDYVTTNITGTCPFEKREPVLRMVRMQLPDADDITGQWTAGKAAKTIVMGMWPVADFGDGESGLEMIKLNFVKNYLAVEAGHIRAFTKTGGTYTYIGQDEDATSSGKKLTLAKVVALANSIDYVRYCDDGGNCTDGQAVTMASDGSSFSIGNGVAPTVVINPPVCTKGSKPLWGSCDRSNLGICFEYYGDASNWSGADSQCGVDGGTWTTNACPKIADLDGYASYPELNPVTPAAMCYGLCTSSTVTVVHIYATTAVSIFRKAVVADAKTQCKQNMGTFKTL